MQHTALEFFADKLSQTIMPEWTGAQIMESFPKSGLLKGRKVPRIPADFATKYQEINDDIDNGVARRRGGGGGGGGLKENKPQIRSKTGGRKVVH